MSSLQLLQSALMSSKELKNVQSILSSGDVSRYFAARLQDILVQRMALKIDAQNPHAFIQEEAFLKGQFILLTELSTLSTIPASNTAPGDANVN